MSQDYNQRLFDFSNGFERSDHHQQQQQHHIAQQIRRDKLRVTGFYPPPPLVGIDEEGSTGLPVYETDGMLSEMFNYQHGSTASSELIQQQAVNAIPNVWYGRGLGGPLGVGKDQSDYTSRDSVAQQQQHQISGINADSAAAMQLFLMNPQPRSPSPPTTSSSSLHMLLPNQNTNSSVALQGFTVSVPGGSVISQLPQFTWVTDGTNNPTEIGRVVEGKGLSLSLSTSLQNMEAAKAEELYFNQATNSSSSQYPYKNLATHHNPLHLMGHNNHQVHVGFGSSFGMVSALRNTKYVKAAQELLEEFCSVGRGQLKKIKLNTNSDHGNRSGGGNVGCSSSTKEIQALSAADRIEYQRRKVKLLSMLDEVERRYNYYCEQMQMVVNSFDMVLGFGAAVPYTALAQKAMSRHFRCLKDAIAAQLKHSCELLGERDGAGTSGITKGETPRLKLLEQSLRQQRAFHQMGMMDQEAWRPQRGLPERSVNILRAWLFEHFLHPYPSDADKHLLARQTGLSRNQVSNWFINARVRLWKPMVEDMYQQESKEEDGPDDNSGFSQTPTPKTKLAAAATTATPPTTTTMTGKRSEINAMDNDPSLVAINSHCFSENQAPITSTTITSVATTFDEAEPPISKTIPATVDNTCRRMTGDYGTISADAAELGSRLIRFGTSAGDVSLTLGLRHAGNMPEKASCFVRDFSRR